MVGRLHSAAGAGIGRRARNVPKNRCRNGQRNAGFGRERRLDQMVGHILERRIVVLDAAIADLVAVAVEECDASSVFSASSRRKFRERRNGQHQHQHQAAGASVAASDSGSTIRQRRQPAIWNRSMKVVNRS